MTLHIFIFFILPVKPYEKPPDLCDIVKIFKLMALHEANLLQ